MEKRRCSIKPDVNLKNCKCFPSKRVEISKFDHQVGGHTRMRILGNRYVCKPLNLREMSFYESCPGSFRRFLPNYEGILKYDYNDDYIVLENLLYGLKVPSVIDFKMGVRMYGDFASPEKKSSQRIKSYKSTSYKLGVRLCGCKWYDYRTNNTYQLDKYSGRNFSESEFRQIVIRLLSSAGHRRKRLIVRSISEKIAQLREVISQMNSFRFYSSSLLIAFEGAIIDNDEDESYDKVVVKLIDFANCTYEGFLDDDIVHSGPDKGFIKGLDTLLDILKSAQRSSRCSESCESEKAPSVSRDS